MLSIIIPFYNEEANVDELYQRIVAAVEELDQSFEIICVNDGSTDDTEARLRTLAEADSRLKLINLRRNRGQTTAMMAGIDHARGEVMIPMDGDLQNDPADIGRLLEKLDEGYSVVSGWRKDRKDKWLTRRLPSIMANRVISWISGVKLHDYGCSLKAYRREVLEDVKLYGEMHRFVPIFASWEGARVTEIPVNHFPRIHGTSKYGLERVIKVILDLIVVKFLAVYETRPVHLFGIIGLLNILIAFLSGIFAVYLKLFEDISFIQTPLPLLVVMTFMIGVVCILLGLLAELLVRTYYESQNKSTYSLRDTLNIEDDG